MKAKKAIKALEKQLRKDPESLVLRLRLAAGYREVGRGDEAVELYRSVAVAYHASGRIGQAIAVCKSVLEINPTQRETQDLLAELDEMMMTAPRPAPEPTPAPIVPARTPRRRRSTGAAGVGGTKTGAQVPARPRLDTGASRKSEAQREFANPRDSELDVRPMEELTGSDFAAKNQPKPARSPDMYTTTPAAAPPPPQRRKGRKTAPPPAPRNTVHGHAAPPIAKRPRPAPGTGAPQDPRNPSTSDKEPATPGRRRGNSTQPMAGPPEMRGRSTPLITPTPLPRPLALHDTGDSQSAFVGSPYLPRALPDSDEPATPVRDLQISESDAEDDDEETRIADAGINRMMVGPDAPTRIADESGELVGVPQVNVAPDFADDSIERHLPPADSHRIPPPMPPPLPPPLPEPTADARPPSVEQQPADGDETEKVVRQPASFFSRDTRELSAIETAAIAADAARAKSSPLISPPDDDFDKQQITQKPQTRRLGATTTADLRKAVDDFAHVPTPAPPPPDDEQANDRLTVPIPRLSPAEIRVAAAGEDGDELEEPTDVQSGVNEGVVTNPGAGLRSRDARGAGDDAMVTNPGAGLRSRDPGRENRQTVPPEQVLETVRDSVNNLHVEHPFGASFSRTLSSLAPDGSAIDQPLAVFSNLPDAALMQMSERMVVRQFAAGVVVLREGETGEACYVIATGQVRVLKRNPLNPRGELIEVARLGGGALFGEFALLADRRRHATVETVEDSTIYEIPRRLLRELAATFPQVGPLLEKFYRERLLATLLWTAPFFRSLPEDRRAELLARFSPMRAESRQRVVVEGEKAGGLYLIVMGGVEITKRVNETQSVLLATLGEGSYFGEMSLLKGEAACATVTAEGHTELAVMAPKDFYEVVADNPSLWDEVRREANRRQLETNQLVTGETNIV